MADVPLPARWRHRCHVECRPAWTELRRSPNDVIAAAKAYAERHAAAVLQPWMRR